MLSSKPKKNQLPDPFDLELLKKCCGYDEKFIDGQTAVTLDVLSPTHLKHLPKVLGNKRGLLNYTNISVWYNKDRRVPFVAAYNIDGSVKKTAPKNRPGFQIDPRIKGAYQIKELYGAVKGLVYDGKKVTEFEIGHMASNNEMSWGPDYKIKAFQTFHFTNSVPQVERLNSGMWRGLESYVIQELSEVDQKRICVFTGPMLREDNPTYKFDSSFKVPLYFFKIIVFPYKEKLYSTGFVMSQYQRTVELGLIERETKPLSRAFKTMREPFTDYLHKDIFQVDIDLIEDYTNFTFKWKKVERIGVPHQEHKLEELSRIGSSADLKPARAFSTKSPAKLNIIFPK